MSFSLEGARILVTGGAGFIGSHLVRHLVRERGARVTTLDALTYAGRRANLADLEGHTSHRLVVGDVRDPAAVAPLLDDADAVCHLAAETHVDRSIAGGVDFVSVDAVGTATLLEAARERPVERFLHVSTDEVYGEIGAGRAPEEAPLRPRNPYSASKAAADHLVAAYRNTHGLPTLVARPSNHYGPHQYPEKLVPLFIIHAVEGRPLPLYGDGRQRREWTHVHDGVSALARILESGEVGGVYNVGSGEEHENLEVARAICRHTGADPELIRHVTDRPGHDRRYALDCGRLRGLGWEPAVDFDSGLETTVSWYLSRRDWWEPIVRSSPGYQSWISSQYDDS